MPPDPVEGGRPPLLARAAPLLSHSMAPAVVAAVAVALCLPALGGHLAIDDYFHLAALQGWGPSYMSDQPLLQLFNFLPDDPANRAELWRSGLLPWWASPDLRGSFFRPVTAATHMLDHWLWPDIFPLHHLHSLLWFGLGVFLVARLYRELGGAAFAMSGLAALMFAVDDAHALPAAWLANRNAAVALVWATLALHLHVRWRRAGRTWRLGASLLCTLLSLLSAEAGLGVVAYMAAYQLTLDRGPLPRRLLCLAPVAALVLAWRAAYTALGHGAIGGGLYLDPAGEPAQFALGVLERWPVLMLSQWSQLTADPWSAMPRAAQLGMSLAGVATLAAVAALVRPLLARSARARFWAIGMALSALPACAAFPMTRLTLFTGIGAFGLLAALARDLNLMGGNKRRRAHRRWRLGLARLLLVLHLPLAALSLAVSVLAVPVVTDFVERVAQRSAGRDPAVSQRTLLMINSYDMLTMYIPAIRQAAGLPAPRRAAQLAALSTDLSLTRPGPRALTITAEGGFLGNSTDHLFWHPRHTFRPGETRRHPDFVAHVDRITDDGRPLQVTFRFPVPLEHPSLIWRAMVQGRVRPFSPPVPGETRRLPATLPHPFRE